LDRNGEVRVPSFVPGVTRGTSTLKFSLECPAESSAASAETIVLRGGAPYSLARLIGKEL